MSRFEFKDCTPEEQSEVPDTWVPPKGFIKSESNAYKITEFIISRKGAWSHENLTAATNALRDQLEWNYADLRSTKAKLQDLGIRQDAHASQDQKEADFEAKKKLAKDFLENGPFAKHRRQEQEQARWNAEHQTLYFTNGRIDHCGTDAARTEAIAKHQALDAAAARAATAKAKHK
jgi:hypothetical protein